MNNMHIVEALSFSNYSFSRFVGTIIIITTLSLVVFTGNSALDTFIYVGCSQLRYNPGTPYESNVNSVLASLVNSATLSNFNNFKISLPGSTQSDVVYGLFQCRGDLTNSDCRRCVSGAVARLGTLCGGASGGVLQLDGCLIRYDNVSFLGAEDKSVASSKCGPSMGYDADLFARRDAVLAYLTGGGGQYFRVGGSGKVQGIGQCVQDLSVGECQDCLSEAIGRLRSECGSSAWGDMFLSKCYARYSEARGYSSSKSGSDDEMEKTLAIIIGLVAAVAVLIVCLSFLSKLFDRKGGK